jgi:cytochrome P450
VVVDIANFDPLSEAHAQRHWEELAEIRECPVGKSDLYGGLWFISKYDDVARAARDWQTYSSAQGSSPVPLDTGGDVKLMPIHTDPPLQRDLRRLIDRHFGPKLVATAEPALRQIAVELFEKFESRGSVEFMSEYAVPYPAQSFFMYAFGVEPDERVMRWLADIVHSPHTAGASVQQFFRWTKGVLDARRAGEPRDDVLNSLLIGTVNGRELEESERMMVMMNLIIGGVETTTQALGNIVHHLATRPGLRERLAAERELIPAAVEEFLRFEAPSSLRGRVATCPVDIDGAHIERDDRVVLSYGAANRDPAKYENPDELVVDRFAGKAVPHMTFGAGPHRCPGSHLARLELVVSLGEVLDRFSDITLSIDRVHYSAGITRGIVELPLAFRRVVA